MKPQRTERVAHEAARLYELGEAQTVGQAIRAAVDLLGTPDPPVTPGRVRQHIQAMAMQAHGEAGYLEIVRGVYEQAEQFMTALDHLMPEVRAVLVGRAAKGLVDGTTALHLRVYTELPVSELAERLVQIGYDEPDIETVNTKHGRLNRLRFADEGLELILTRCLPPMYATVGEDLFTGRETSVMLLSDVRACLADPSR